MVGRIMLVHLQNVHTLTTGTYEYVPLPGQGILQMWLRVGTLMWGDDFGSAWWAQLNDQSSMVEDEVRDGKRDLLCKGSPVAGFQDREWGLRNQVRQ